MKVKFLPMDIELEIKPNQSVMNLAHENDVHISSVCNGMPSCAECRVRLVDGEHNVIPPGAKELSLIGTGHFIDQRRLSCQLICFGDITVDLTEQVEKASEAKVNKKHLKRAQKEHPEEVHAKGGVFIEQDEDFRKEISDNPMSEGPGKSAPETITNLDKDFYGRAKTEEQKKSGPSRFKRGDKKQHGDKRGRNRRRGKKPRRPQ